MEKQKGLGDIYMMGIEGDSYRELLDIAKKQGKTVGEVASDALKKEIERSKGLSESKQRRILTEG